MNADVLTTRSSRWHSGDHYVLGRAQGASILDRRSGDALTAALDDFAGDANVVVVVVTGPRQPVIIIRHYSIAGALFRLAESLRASGREWLRERDYKTGWFHGQAIALCESIRQNLSSAAFPASPGRWIRVRALLRSSYR